MFRRYNRWWSRFDQPDPYDGSYDLSDPQSLNRYSYTQNDPVNFTDPTGLFPQDPRQGPPPGDAWNDEGSAVDIGTVRVWARRWWQGAGYLFGGEVAAEEGADGPGGGGVGGPQQPTPSQQGRLSEEDCNKKLASIFGGKGAVAATVHEPPGVRGGGNNYIHHLANNGTIHLYTNAQGTSAQVGLYAPAGGTYDPKRSRTYREKDLRGRPMETYSNVRRYSYDGGLVISFFHVGSVPRGANIPRTNATGFRIGTIGGLGGTGTNYNHTHIQFDVNGTRTDPRTIYCGY